MKRRVVVTGLGIVSSIGIGKDEFWDSLIEGRSGISQVESIDTTNYPTRHGGEIKGLRAEPLINKRRKEFLGRASQLAINAAQLALKDAGLSRQADRLGKRIGVALGTTMGEIRVLESIDDLWVEEKLDTVKERLALMFPADVMSSNISLALKFLGINFMFPTACAAGNYAIGYCYDLIQSSNIDILLAGGSDAFSRVAFSGFSRLYAMAPERCQPFDKNRKGMMLGEGAAILVIESLESALKRKANIYAEILGYGLSCDAHHMTQPSEEGIAKCMIKAMDEAGIAIEDVDYISAHGTGTPQNDKTEVSAIKKVFGKRYKKIPVSSIKSMLGHTMGAASAMEAAACCLALKEEILPPTINYETPDPECDIDCVPNTARKQKVDIALNNSYAFGGNNACLVIKRCHD